MTANEIPAAQVFVRRIEIPPGTPWDQLRAAWLEAKAGAPLAQDQVFICLRRLGPWRARHAGAYAAGYVRKAAVQSDLTHEARLENQVVRFVFREEAATVRRRRDLVAAVLMSVAALALVCAAGRKTVSLRLAGEGQLQHLEANAARQVRIQRHQRQAEIDRRLIRRAGAEGHGFDGVTADLAWLAAARAPTARIDEIHWSSGELRLRARGLDKPVRGDERAIIAEETEGGATTWRIKAAAPPQMRHGLVRPSVRSETPGPQAPR